MAVPLSSSYRSSIYNQPPQTCTDKTIQALKITGIVLAILALVAASVVLSILFPPVAVVYAPTPYYYYSTPLFFPFI